MRTTVATTAKLAVEAVNVWVLLFHAQDTGSPPDVSVFGPERTTETLAVSGSPTVNDPEKLAAFVVSVGEPVESGIPSVNPSSETTASITSEIAGGASLSIIVALPTSEPNTGPTPTTETLKSSSCSNTASFRVSIRTSNWVEPAGTVTKPSFGTATQPEPVLYSSVPRSPTPVSPVLRVSWTWTAASDSLVSETTKLAVSPSLIVPASLIDTVGRSSSGSGSGPVPSSTMVAVPVSVPWTGPKPVTSTVKFSGPS